jgi:hypothetical protein
MSRIATAELHELAVDQLAAVLTELGLRVERTGDPGDLEVTVDDRTAQLRVESVAYATREHVESLLRTPLPRKTSPVVVADRITAAARDLLTSAGWSWFDRRGHVRLRVPGVVIDRDIDAAHRPATKSAPEPISGLSGRAVSYALLTDPAVALPVRASAPRLGMSPASISTALTRLRAAGLVERDGRPVLPELFWALADAWRPARTWLRKRPTPRDPATGVVNLEEAGWCLTGTAAAVEWGAPVVSRGGSVDLYVPGPVVVSVAARKYGTVEDPMLSAASIAVPPVSQVTRHRCAARRRGAWPLSHPVAVALDLAQDIGRGREILNEWTPLDGFARVW